MGINIFRSSSFSSYDFNRKSSNEQSIDNPDPYKYEIKSHIQENKYLIVHIIYPDCKNYEGEKILLYEDITIMDLIKQKSIDPHFSENKDFYSPIARFEPTKKGSEMALLLAITLNKKE